MNHSKTRAEALGQVMRGSVFYDARTGSYSTAIKELGGLPRSEYGASRRTYADLRRGGLIKPTVERGLGAVAVTEEGLVVAEEWGLTSPTKVG